MGVTGKNRNINMECRCCSKSFFFSISRFGEGERPCLKLFLDLKNEGWGCGWLVLVLESNGGNRA